MSDEREPWIADSIAGLQAEVADLRAKLREANASALDVVAVRAMVASNKPGLVACSLRVALGLDGVVVVLVGDLKAQVGGSYSDQARGLVETICSGVSETIEATGLARGQLIAPEEVLS